MIAFSRHTLGCLAAEVREMYHRFLMFQVYVIALYFKNTNSQDF